MSKQKYLAQIEINHGNRFRVQSSVVEPLCNVQVQHRCFETVECGNFKVTVTTSVNKGSNNLACDASLFIISPRS